MREVSLNTPMVPAAPRAETPARTEAAGDADVSAIEAAEEHEARARRTGARRRSTNSGAPQSTTGSQSNELTAPQVATLGVIFAPLMDPMLAMSALQNEVRNGQLQNQEADAADGDDRAELAESSRMHQLDKARRALKKMRKRMPRWLKGIIAAVVAAIGAVASVVTGGASVVLTAVALAFMFAGDALQFAVEKGMLPADPSAKIAAGLKIVGAVLSSVASLGAGSAGAAATIADATVTVIKVAKQISDIVVAVVQTIEGSIDINNAVRQLQADMAQLSAELQATLRDEAAGSIDDALSEMRGTHTSFQRVMQRLRGALDARAQMNDAPIHAMA